MKNPFKRSLRSLRFVAPAVATLAVPSLALGEDVHLKSGDGVINLKGELIEFKDNSYIIKSKFGALRVDASRVECFGAGCPGGSELPDGVEIVAPSDQAGSETVVTWDVSLWGKRRAFTEHVEKLAELVSEKTGGDFQLNISYGGLSDSRENLDGISAGSFEMAQFCAGYHRDKNPTITVLELPFLGVDNLEQEIDLSMAVYQHPATRADLARWNATLLMPSPLPQYNIVGTGFPPTSLADFKGMTVRATGGVGNAIASLGSELVSLPATQVREAMDDGTVRAVSFAPHAHMSFDTIENGTWWTTNLNPGTVNCPVVINTDALNDLTDANRIALLSSVDAALDEYVANYEGATMDAWGPALDEKGVSQLTINPSIISAIKKEVAAPAAAAWIAENTLRGLPAQELYDLVTTKIATGS